MFNKRVLLAFFASVLLGLILLLNYNKKPTVGLTKTENAPSQAQESIDAQSAGKAIGTQDQQSHNPSTQLEQLSDERQTILNEIESRIYSEDPYVELISLSVNMSLCRKEFEHMNFLTYSATVFQQQNQLNQDLKKACKAYWKLYPQILSMGEKQMRNVFKPDSQLGHLLQVQESRNLLQKERDENYQLTLLHALKEKNSSVIMLSALLLGYSGSGNGVLKSILQSNDNSYIAQMNQLALTLISCGYQNGQSCQSTSVLMVMACSESPDSCGLDFETWYERNTLPGMKRDVEKLMAYYQRISL